jgi:hypothetical protein
MWNKKKDLPGGVAHVVQCLFSKCEFKSHYCQKKKRRVL